MTEHSLDLGGIIATGLQLEWFSYTIYLLSMHNHIQIVSVKISPYCTITRSMKLRGFPDLKCPFIYSNEMSVKQFQLQPTGEKNKHKNPVDIPNILVVFSN